MGAPGSLFATSPTHPILAALHHNTICIYSTDNDSASANSPASLIQIIPIDPSHASSCTSIRFYRPPSDPHAKQNTPQPARLLLASDTALHIYDALDLFYHASITNAAFPSFRITEASLISEEEVLVTPDLAPQSTIWDLRTTTGLQIRNPKPGLRANGYSIRPNGVRHVALLTRPASAAQRDVVVILSPRPQGTGRMLEGEFALDTYDARGIRWSRDGKWLAVWDAPSMGPGVWVYAAEGSLLKKWDDGRGGQDGVGLGVEKVEWDIEGRLVVGMGDGRVVLLGGKSVSLVYSPNDVWKINLLCT